MTDVDESDADVEMDADELASVTPMADWFDGRRRSVESWVGVYVVLSVIGAMLFGLIAATGADGETLALVVVGSALGAAVPAVVIYKVVSDRYNYYVASLTQLERLNDAIASATRDSDQEG